MNPTAGERIILRPSSWRYFLVRFLLLLFATMLGFATGTLEREHMPIDRFVREELLVVLPWEAGVAALVTFIDAGMRGDRSITLFDDCIDGPAGTGWKRVTFRFDQLDRERSRRRRWYQRLLGYRDLWSVDNQKIVVEDIGFTKDQLAILLNALRLGDGAFGEVVS